MTRPLGPTTPRPSALQWSLGILVLGWGLSILLGMVPHEDLLVGCGLALFGAALAAACRTIPRLPRIPAAVLALLGALLVLGGGVFLAFGWDLPKAALVALGALFVAAAPFQDRTLRVLHRDVPVATLSFSLLPLALGPAAIYALQGLFSRGTGTTPVEAFLDVGLLAPVAFVLGLVGLAPHQDGQMLSFATPHGPLRMEVGVACSGLQAMALFAGMLGLLLAVERPPPKVSALLVAVGLAGVYLANLLRLLLLAGVGYAWGAEALEQAHAQAGWALFVAWAVVFALWARRRLARIPRPSPALDAAAA